MSTETEIAIARKAFRAASQRAIVREGDDPITAALAAVEPLIRERLAQEVEAAGEAENRDAGEVAALSQRWMLAVQRGDEMRKQRDEARAEADRLREQVEQMRVHVEEVEADRESLSRRADNLRVALGELAEKWLARIPHQSGAFYPEASAYDDGKDTATDACADDLRAILAADPVSLADKGNPTEGEKA